MPGQSNRGVSRRRFLASAGVVGVAAVGGCVENVQPEGDTDEVQDVVVTGSSTVYPVSDAMAGAYRDDHENVSVTVDSTGTGGGFQNNFCPGTSVINGASRRIQEPELNTCRDNGVEPIEFQIGADALTVAVNNDLEAVDCMTFAELSQIWRQDGADTWADVRSEWPDEEIKLYGPPSTSGTFDWFNENVIGEEYDHTSDHQKTEKDDALVQGIEGDPYAMGYFGYAYYAEEGDRVKAVEIRRDEEGSCTPPSLENASDGSYPLARPLFIYVDRNALERTEVFEFVSFYLEEAATETVRDVGYVPIDEETRDENLAKLVRERP
jgi:phosphate transport system substrate-binding protein